METHTLHIAINNYVGTGNDLSGCVNDARHAERLFGRRRRGTVRDHIDNCPFFGDATSQVVLIDRQATRPNVLAAIAELLGKLERKDLGVITFSGHGTYVDDESGDEADGFDEALVTQELDVILDDELGELLANRAVGSRLIFQTDACHSGTATRSIGPRLLDSHSPHRGRFLPPARLKGRPGRARRSAKMRRTPRLVDVIHFGGCADDQTSADTEFSGVPQGAHSYYWFQSLSKLRPGATYGDWVAALAKLLPNHTFDQCPQTNAYARALAWQIPVRKK